MILAALILTATCHTGPRADLACTPGAMNPAVTQTTIHRTICQAGYTATIRPPVTVTDKIKTERMAAYGLTGRRPADYELDHLVPLELGGAPSSVANLWPELWAGPDGAHTKDKLENRLHREVCAGQITLGAAQREILTAWTRRYGS